MHSCEAGGLVTRLGDWYQPFPPHIGLSASYTYRGAILISMGSLFGRQSAPLLGIDISSSTVKLVELGRDKAGSLVLERCAIELLERGWITDGNVEKFDEVADALRRLIKKSGAKTKNVALALPPSAVITKRITLPGGMTEQELEIQVESEANQYIPFSLDEVSLDFCVVGPSKTAADDVEVLIAASRREKVQDRQGLAEAAGLKAVVIDIESHAARMAAGRLIQALPNQGVDAVVALFGIGALTTTILGLKAVVIDIESHAARMAAGRLIQALPNQGVDAVVALFGIGALTTSMQVL